jgi:LysM repeat protein
LWLHIAQVFDRTPVRAESRLERAGGDEGGAMTSTMSAPTTPASRKAVPASERVTLASTPATRARSGRIDRGDGSAGPSPGRRLTRRGRVLVLLVAIGALLGVFSLGRFAAPASSVSPTRTITVSAGQTLWQIARHAAPGADPRMTVARIEALNHLDGPAVRAGQPLRVPGR